MKNFLFIIWLSIKKIFTKYLFFFFDFIADNCALFAYSLRYSLGRGKKGQVLIKNITKKQIYFTGVQSFLLIGVISLLLGVVITVESVTVLSKINAADFIGKILVLAIVREFGPILTALIIIGRSASAIATEIGNMSVNKEIEALQSMNINPLEYIFIPRMAGMVISMVILTIYFIFIGIAGGFAATRIMLSVPFATLNTNLANAISLIDVLVAILKSAGFGIIIATVSVYQGFSVKLSTTEVPRAATKAVVNSLFIAFIYNALLTVLFYM